MEGVVLYLLKKELEPELINAKIEEVKKQENHTFLFFMSKKDKRISLLLNFSSSPLVFIDNKIRDGKPASSWEGFLSGWVIKDLWQDDWNRIYRLTLEKKNEKRFLYIEFTGRFSNMILTDEKGNIITALKPMGFSLEVAKRVIRGGFPYKVPQFKKKYFPWEIELERMLSSKKDGMVIDTLIDNLKGIGKYLAEDMLFYMGYSKDLSFPLEERDVYKISTFLNKTYKDWESYRYTPYLLNKGDLSRLTLFLLPESKEKNSISIALSELYKKIREEHLLKIKKHRLIRLLDKNICALEKKIEHIKRELFLSKNADEFRKKGELLKINLSQLKKGMKNIKVIDYYKYPPEEVVIELDPDLSPQENIEKYFKKYSKYKKGQEKLEKIYLHLTTELKRAKNLKTQIQSEENLLWIENQLKEFGLIREKEEPIMYKGKKVKFHKFVSPDGFLILVGKSAKDNETILKVASPNDYWLHVRDIPGSHVIIKRNGKKEVPFSTIKYAASIAAYFSKARNDSNVGVDYTLRKYVKPIKGGGSGFVNFREEKTIYVNPLNFKTF